MNKNSTLHSIKFNNFEHFFSPVDHGNNCEMHV